ncbi:MAG: hypothetical protein H6585_07540 [Flavobacteriales bacterium]|nr:hypothetical protein [Flavobacteriales bacterium]MCB9448179.1 hypothetical protein [Flavobacteriales bacterium]
MKTTHAKSLKTAIAALTLLIGFFFSAPFAHAQDQEDIAKTYRKSFVFSPIYLMDKTFMAGIEWLNPDYNKSWITSAGITLDWNDRGYHQLGGAVEFQRREYFISPGVGQKGVVPFFAYYLSGSYAKTERDNYPFYETQHTKEYNVSGGIGFGLRVLVQRRLWADLLAGGGLAASGSDNDWAATSYTVATHNRVNGIKPAGKLGLQIGFLF